MLKMVDFDQICTDYLYIMYNVSSAGYALSYMEVFIEELMGSENRVLDCSGVRCGLLALKTKKALDELTLGDRIEVVSDDVAALSDVQHLAMRLGYKVVSSSKTPGQVRVTLEKV